MCSGNCLQRIRVPWSTRWDIFDGNWLAYQAASTWPCRPRRDASSILACMPSSDISFDFWLRPLEDVEPWDSGEKRTLHWFRLTDGLCRVTVGGKELFEYDTSLLEQLGWRTERRPKKSGHAADYYVAHLVHDLSSIAPPSRAI